MSNYRSLGDRVEDYRNALSFQHSQTQLLIDEMKKKPILYPGEDVHTLDALNELVGKFAEDLDKLLKGEELPVAVRVFEA